MSSRIVLAIGGNSLIRSKGDRSFDAQLAAVAETCRHIGDIVEAGHEVVITHGNGPQVGFLLVRAHLARKRLPETPLDAANAQTQAEIGYMIQQSLGNELNARGIAKGVATVVTQVLVDRQDPAFTDPSKPVGAFYTKREAAELQRTLGWAMREDAGRGFRRLVASPKPVEIIEQPEVERLLGSGSVVIACGGGGIPVVREDGRLKGVAAVIDKDNASSLLAANLKADRLVISTAVEHVATGFGTSKQRPLLKVSAAELRKHLDAGEFPAGSMGPKVRAALAFLEAGGRAVVITDPGHITAALAGETGTTIVPGGWSEGPRVPGFEGTKVA